VAARVRERRLAWSGAPLCALFVACGGAQPQAAAGGTDGVAPADAPPSVDSAVDHEAGQPAGAEQPSDAALPPYSLDALQRATVDGAWWLHRVTYHVDEGWMHISVASADDTGVTLTLKGCNADGRMEESMRLSWPEYLQHLAPEHDATERLRTRAEIGGEVLDVWVLGDGTRSTTYDASLPGPPLRAADDDLTLELFARGVAEPSRPVSATEDGRLVGAWTADTAALSRELAAGPPTTETVVAAALLGEALLRITLESGGAFATRYVVGDMDVTTRGEWWTEPVDDDTVVLSTQDDHGCGFPFPVESATIDFDGNDVWMTDATGLRLRLLPDAPASAAE
jgi:hypothetical protein